MSNTHLHDRYRAHQENEKALWKDYYDCCVKEIETILRGHDGEIDISKGDIEWIDRQADRCGHPYMVTLFTEHNFISLQHLTLHQLCLILEEVEEKDELDED